MALPNVPGQLTLAQELQFNGADHEFVRANIEQTIRASGTASATVTSADITNFNATGAIFFVDITSVPGSGSATVSLTIQAKDPASGNYTNMVAFGALSAGTTSMFMYPGATSGSFAANLALPRTFRALSRVSAGATSKDVVFSVGMAFLR